MIEYPKKNYISEEFNRNFITEGPQNESCTKDL